MTNEDELQSKIEKKIHVEPSGDSRAYQKVFESASRDPFDVPTGFADAVIRKMHAREKSLSGDYIWLAIGLLAFVASAFGTIVFTHFSLDFGALKFISGYAGLMIFTVIIVLLFHWLDKFVIRKKLQITL